jgi:hypothetical protein
VDVERRRTGEIAVAALYITAGAAVNASYFLLLRSEHHATERPRAAVGPPASTLA